VRSTGRPSRRAGDLHEHVDVIEDHHAIAVGPQPIPCLGTLHEDATFAMTSASASVASARALTATTLGEWRLEELSDAMTLVVSELVTNALSHGLYRIDEKRRWLVVLRLARAELGVTCVISDPSDQPPVLKESDYGLETGRGLHLVAWASSRWGWRRCSRRHGKLVWATFGTPPGNGDTINLVPTPRSHGDQQ
jgi:hypothetical protein